MAENKLDVTSTALEKSIDLVKGFIERIAGSSLDEAGLIFGGNLRVRRLKNEIKIWSEVQKIAAENNLSVKQLNLKLLVPLLDLSSLEEDVKLQKRWSNLILNFIDSKSTFDNAVYPYILSQLSTKEVLALEEFSGWTYIPFHEMKISKAEASNLIRLGLVEKQVPKASIKSQPSLSKRDRQIVVYDNEQIHTITELGKEFIQCCSAINSSETK